MDLKDAIHLFEEKNGICINKFHSDRRQCFEKNLYPDQYIGQDIFENNIECWIENFDERKVFLQLLANYIYVPEIMYGLKFDDLLSQIVEKCEKGKEILKQTYFVTFPSSKGIKSGGDVIRDILPIGHLDCIKKEQLIADIKRNKKSISNAKCIVFIDDVIGSGRTAKRNIADFFQLEGINFKEKRYFLAALYAESSIKKELEAELEKLEYKVKLLVDHECRKGFSENYIFAENETESKNIIMEAEEKIAGKKVGKDQSYALGYENSQLLLSFFYNTPNNTLCMFWKPTETNFPLFVRNSFHRPSLADIKRNREIKRKNAYAMAKEERAEK